MFGSEINLDFIKNFKIIFLEISYQMTLKYNAEEMLCTFRNINIKYIYGIYRLL